MDEPGSKRRRTNLIVIKDEGSTCSTNSRPSSSIPQEASNDETPIPAAVPSNPRARQRSNSSQNNSTTNHRDMSNSTHTDANNRNVRPNSTSPNLGHGNAANRQGNNNSQPQRNQHDPQRQNQTKDHRKSPPPQQQQQPELSEVDHAVRQLLGELRTGRTVDAALTAMERLYRTLLGQTINNNHPRNPPPKDSNISLEVARKITQWNGCGGILMALKDWYMESTEFACRAIRVLVLITGSVPIAKQFIVELGGLRTLVLASEAGLHVYVSSPAGQKKKVRRQMTVQQRKQLEYNLQSNVVGLLHNLMGGVDYSIGKEVAAEECLDLVINSLRNYPNDKYTQKRGIRYLLKAGKMQDSQVIAMLQKKQVGILFVQALDRFRHTNPGVKEMAQEALMWYASN